MLYLYTHIVLLQSSWDKNMAGQLLPYGDGMMVGL